MDAAAIGREIVLENDGVVGSVSANRRDYEAAVDVLGAANRSWLDRVITRRVPLEWWEKALEWRAEDVKTVIEAAELSPGAPTGPKEKRTAAGWLVWLVVRLRHVIVVAWIAAAVAAAVALPNLREAQTGSFGDLVPDDAEAIDAELRSNELFGFPLLSRTVVVQRESSTDEPGRTDSPCLS